MVGEKDRQGVTSAPPSLAIAVACGFQQHGQQDQELPQLFDAQPTSASCFLSRRSGIPWDRSPFAILRSGRRIVLRISLLLRHCHCLPVAARRLAKKKKKVRPFPLAPLAPLSCRCFLIAAPPSACELLPHQSSNQGQKNCPPSQLHSLTTRTCAP